MIKKDGNTMIIDTFRDLKSSSAEFNKAKRKTVKLIVKSAEHDQKVIDIINTLKEMRDLEWVEIQNPDTKLCSIDGMLYSGNKQKLYLCPRGKTGNLVIHDGAELSCDYACAWVRCDQVTIPDSVKSIGENAFAFNLNLKKVEGGRNIQNIKPFAFYRCYRLKRFEFGEKLKIIGSSAFDYHNGA